MKIKKQIVAKIPEEKRPKIKKTLTVLRVIKNIVCWTLIIVLSFAVITFMLTRFTGGTPSLFGYSVQRVSSGSMEPELMVGDVILSKRVEDIASVTTGDIITFKGGAQFEDQNVTHRVVRAPYAENGVTMLQTKGDANEIADDPIRAEQVEFIMQRKLPLLTKAYELFLSPWGLIIFIVLLLLVFFDELLNIVRIVSGNYAEEDEESISEIIERIRREDAEKKRSEKEESRRKITELMSETHDE